MKKLWQHVEHYLLLSVSLSFLSGILLYHFFPASPAITLAITFLFFIPALLFNRLPGSQKALIFLLLLVVSLGYGRMAYHSHRFQQETHIYSSIKQETDVLVSGTLHSMVLFDGEKSKILLKSNLMRKKEESSFSPVTGLLLISLKDTFPEHYRPGDELLLRCTLSHPYTFANPGSFDYPAFLAAKDIALVGRLRSTAHIQALQYEKSLLRTLRYLPERLRCTIRDFLNSRFAPEEAAIYRALIIGDRSGISKERFESFKASGVVHIFAISGIHLSLVASVLFFLFYWLLRRSSRLLLHFSCKKLALLATLPFLTAYALLAGAQTPVLRSLIMVALFIVAFCVQRQRSPFTILSCAALLILIANPSSLFTVSFQLSFSAVASLILLLPQLQHFLQQADSEKQDPIPFYTKAIKWILAALLVSTVATLGTAPLLLHSFNRISIVGPLANLLLEPLLCLWSLPLGLLATPFISIAPPLADFLFSLGQTGIRSALFFSDFFAALPFSTLWLATPSAVLVLCYYLALLLCFLKFSAKTFFSFLLVCSLFFFPPRSLLRNFQETTELVFLDVGQGSATFISLPHGKTILVDGGGASSRKFNVGESILAPYFWYRGLTRLDALVISHPDADHYNGIPFLLERFRPEVLWINGDSGHDQHYSDLLALAKTLNIDIRISEEEQVIFAEDNIKLQNILNPLQFTDNAVSNDRSIILRFSQDQFSCILSGDITRRVEQKLVQNNNNIEADILLAPHHGSNTSSSYPFLKKVNPQQIIVSAGRFRPNNFPSKRLRDYCSANAIPLINTATAGAITVSVSKEKTTLSSFKQQIQ